MNKALSHVEAALERANARVTHLKSLRDRLLGQTFITCAHCKSHSAINSIVYIQTHWYVRPFSCNGGNYWNEGEGQWDCPLCHRNNRLYDKPEIMALKRLFKSVRDCYCDYYTRECDGCRKLRLGDKS